MAKNRFAEPVQYAHAIASALHRAPAKHRDLLQAHFTAPRHTRTYSQLAKDVGYANYGAVNLQYGTLARRVAEALGILVRPSEGFWGIVLVEWTDAFDPSGSRFRLRPAVVEALRSLGFERTTATRSNKRLQPTPRVSSSERSKVRARGG